MTHVIIGAGVISGTLAAGIADRTGHRFGRCDEGHRRAGDDVAKMVGKMLLPWCSAGRLRYRLTLRDLSEIMLLRGFIVNHECIWQWEAKLLPVMGDALRKLRHGSGRHSG